VFVCTVLAHPHPWMVLLGLSIDTAPEPLRR
jgi:hypothetical protein